jgi:hypothetical protein
LAAGKASGYMGRNGAGWLAGTACPILPVDSDSFGPRLLRRLMSVSRSCGAYSGSTTPVAPVAKTVQPGPRPNPALVSCNRTRRTSRTWQLR